MNILTSKETLKRPNLEYHNEQLIITLSQEQGSYNLNENDYFHSTTCSICEKEGL